MKDDQEVSAFYAQARTIQGDFVQFFTLFLKLRKTAINPDCLMHPETPVAEIPGI